MSTDGDGGVGVIWARAVACRVSRYINTDRQSVASLWHFVRFHFHLSPFCAPLWSACNGTVHDCTTLFTLVLSTDCWATELSCHCILNTLSFVLWIFNLYRAQRWRLSRCCWCCWPSETVTVPLHLILIRVLLLLQLLFASSEWASAFTNASFCFSFAHCHLY